MFARVTALVTASAACLLLSSAALADVHVIEGTGLSFECPQGWSAEPFEKAHEVQVGKGVRCISVEKAATLSGMAIKALDLPKAMDSFEAEIAKAIPDFAKGERSKSTLNGMDTLGVGGSGTLEGHKTIVVMGAVQGPSAGVLLAVVITIRESHAVTYTATYEQMLKSIKPVATGVQVPPPPPSDSVPPPPPPGQ